MKGLSELLEILILVVGISILIIFSYLIFTGSSQRIMTVSAEYHNYERIADAVNAFYYSKISGTERTLAQIFSDSLVLGTSMVNYGEGFGYIDANLQVTKFFDSYFGEKWKLEADKVTLGFSKPSEGRINTFEIILPVPSGDNDLKKAVLYAW